MEYLHVLLIYKYKIINYKNINNKFDSLWFACCHPPISITYIFYVQWVEIQTLKHFTTLLCCLTLKKKLWAILANLDYLHNKMKDESEFTQSVKEVLEKVYEYLLNVLHQSLNRDS